MPNHITNKIIFDAQKAKEIFDSVCPDGKFDFRIFIPQPPQMYRGDLNREDEKDFPCNWHTWNRANWGTKWNAYETTTGIEGEKAFIQFRTAWGVPYPIISAFANKFQIPFVHKYCCEWADWWGIETWGIDHRFSKDDDQIVRLTKSRDCPDDKTALALELLGYDPDQEETDESEPSE